MSKGNIGEHQGGTSNTARPRGGTNGNTPLKGCSLVPLASPRDLAEAIFAAGKLDRSELLAEFTSYVSAHFDEQEFARSFATVHKVFHDWMAM